LRVAWNRINLGKLMKPKRAALLLAAIFVLDFTSGCAHNARNLQAQLAQVSSEMHAQQRQLDRLALQSTNFEQSLKKLEAASPGVGQLMTEAELHFAKLYFAGQARNWDLARFERGELEEALLTATALRPEERGVNISGIMDAFTNGPLKSMQEAIDVYDQPMFRKAYQDSVMMCNACHNATGRPFIVITVPTNPPVFNQRWAPADLFSK
jgi:hypothetical protein